jgi:hypothetical protein
MDVTSTIKALRERCNSFNNRVFGAAQLAEVDLDHINPEAFPTAYVMCIREDPSNLQSTENSYYQEITATVAVVLLLNNQDERGQSSASAAEALKDEVFKAILGWAPANDPMSIYEYSSMWVLVNNRALLGIQLEFDITYAIGVDDTRIPAQLEEDCGNFDTLDMSVDKIETPPGAPDGREDLHVRLTDLYGDDEESSD